MIMKENLAFKKMKPLSDIEECYGVEVGASYRNDYGCASFVDSIATDLKKKLKTQNGQGQVFFFDDR